MAPTQRLKRWMSPKYEVLRRQQHPGSAVGASCLRKERRAAVIILNMLKDNAAARRQHGARKSALSPAVTALWEKNP